MNGQRIEVYQERTISKLMSNGGMKMLHASRAAGMQAKGAIMAVAQSVTKIETYERLEEIAEPLIDIPKIRGRLKQAGFVLPVYNKRKEVLV